MSLPDSELDDFTAVPNSEAINIEHIDKDKLPSFSIVIPTYKDHPALARTLCNIICQSDPARKILRECIVVGDGYEEEAKKVCESANTVAKNDGQNVKVWYYNLKTHAGNGNYPRAAGLKKATGDYVTFFDAGTGVCVNCFATIASVIQKKPDAKLISWDIVQVLDPVPITSVCQLVATQDRTKGLSYVIPGVSAAVKREIAQQVNWPDVRESDWAYFSLLWEKMYGKGSEETEEVKKRMNDEVILIPWVLTVAYANRSERKVRMPATLEDYNKSGYNIGFSEASTTIEAPSGDNNTSATSIISAV